MVQAGSALLAPDTQAAWEQIQRSEAGAVQLLKRFEAYFGNVARNVRRTYLRPFVIVTANMSKGRQLLGCALCSGGGGGGAAGLSSLGKGHALFPSLQKGRQDPPCPVCVNLGDAHARRIRGQLRGNAAG